MKGRITVVGSLFLLLVSVLGFALTGRSQVVLANLSGHVFDSSGAAIPGAKLTVVNVATGFTRSATTSPTGD